MTGTKTNYEKLYFTIKGPSINELCYWKTKSKLLNISDYQCDYVYTKDKPSIIVDSALTSIPLTSIYLCE